MRTGECYVTLGCVLIDDAGTSRDELNSGEAYQWRVPAAIRKEIEKWTIRNAIEKILGSYPASPKDDLVLSVLRDLLAGIKKPTYSGKTYEIMTDSTGNQKGLVVNDKIANLNDKIERYVRYREDVGNMFEIGLSMRESGA